MYFLTKRNDVAHLTVIKTEAAPFCKKGWAPRAYHDIMQQENVRIIRLLLSERSSSIQHEQYNMQHSM